jgi:YtkA-like
MARVLLAVAIATLAGIATIVVGSGGAASGDGPGGPVAVDVTTTNRGHLTVAIDASVTVDAEPLTQAEVVAYTDMTDMPLAHPQGPLPMREVAGEPGRYVAETMLPMPGGYEFRVEVLSPVQGEQRRTMFVGVVE